MYSIKIIRIEKSIWSEISLIYQAGIETQNATFEEDLPDWEEWDRKHLKICRFAARVDKSVGGFIVLSPFSSRPVYRGVAEVSVYVAEEFRRQGLGYRLLQELIISSEKDNIWTLQAGIFPENQTSIRLFHRCGFRTVGIRQKIGQLNGIWRDVVLLERRSRIN